MDIERNIKAAAADVNALLSRDEGYTVDPDALAQRVRARQATRHDFRSYFSKWANLKVLIGTAYSWFALDVGRIAHRIYDAELTVLCRLRFMALGSTRPQSSLRLASGHPARAKRPARSFGRLYVTSRLET